MKRFISIILITGLILVSIPSVSIAKPSKAPEKPLNISTWLWDTAQIVSKPNQIISFLVKNKVNVLFLQVNNEIDIKYYQRFIRKASAKNISVHALDGSAQWVSNDGVISQQEFINWVSKYQNSAAANEKFNGLHLDVEPYLNEEYNTNLNKILENYQNFIVSFKKHAIDLELEFGIDIPFWFYGVEYDTKYGTGNLAKWLCENVKSMTIMAYRDRASSPRGGIIDVSSVEMKLFEEHNVKGTIAVETGNLGPDEDYLTFYGKGTKYMNQQLDLVIDSYRSNTTFDGIAIHYLDSWMRMTK